MVSRISILILTVLLFSGCGNKQVHICEPIIKTEIVEVLKPVVYTLNRPNRPVYDPSKPLPIYQEEMNAYTTELEGIIDGTKRKKGK